MPIFTLLNVIQSILQSPLSQVQFGVAEWPQHAFGIANSAQFAYLAKIIKKDSFLSDE